MYSNHPPPPYYSNLHGGGGYGGGPQYQYRKRSGVSGCGRCICCCCCFLFLVLLLTFTLLYVVFRVYDPRPPSYKLEDIQIKALDLRPIASSITTQLEVSVRADNPNKKMAIIYGDNNWVDVTFQDTILCSGKIPGFRQGYENTTVVKVELKGTSTFDKGMQQAYNESLARHKVPLLVSIRVPVSIMLGETRLREIRAFVSCMIVLDNLAPNAKPTILSEDTRAHFEV